MSVGIAPTGGVRDNPFLPFPAPLETRMPPQFRSSARRFLLAVLSFALLIGLTVAFVDRPLASWVSVHLHDVGLFKSLTLLAEPLAPLASAGLAGAGLAAVAGWRPGRWGRVAIACGLAVLVTLAVKGQLKFAFGRTWPETWIDNNPSWIANGVFAFQPFHGGQGWTSFPSGHTSLIAAPMAVLWWAVPRWRWLYATAVALVGIGLVGADYHWLSDVVAGAYLGAAVGTAMLALVGAGGGAAPC